MASQSRSEFDPEVRAMTPRVVGARFEQQKGVAYAMLRKQREVGCRAKESRAVGSVVRRFRLGSPIQGATPSNLEEERECEEGGLEPHRQREK